MLRSTSYIVIALLVVLTLLATFQPLYGALYFDAALVGQGQSWRPFTAWLVQANLEHWLVNLWGLLVIAIVSPKQLSWVDSLAAITIWIATSLCLWQSNYQAYVGLSGVLYGLLFWFIARSPFYGKGIKIAVLMAIIIKVTLENSPVSLFDGDWLSQWIGSEIAHESHAWGLISGVIVYLGYWLLERSPLGGVRRG